MTPTRVRARVPGERLVMHTGQGPVPMETTYAWADTGDGAMLMTLRNRGEPSGFKRVAAPMMGARDATRQPQGPGPTEADPRGTRGRVKAPHRVAPLTGAARSGI